MCTFHNHYTFDNNDTTDTYHKMYMLKYFISYTKIFPFSDVFSAMPPVINRKIASKGARYCTDYCYTLSHSLYRYCIVAFPPSQISPRKTGYIVAFPPENWLYSSLSPGEILLYSQISPFL